MAIVIVLHPISWKFASSSILRSANFSVKIVIVLFVMKISINTRTYKAISQTVQCDFFRLRVWNPVQFFGMFFSVYMKSKIFFFSLYNYLVYKSLMVFKGKRNCHIYQSTNTDDQNFLCAREGKYLLRYSQFLYVLSSFNLSGKQKTTMFWEQCWNEEILVVGIRGLNLEILTF